MAVTSNRTVTVQLTGDVTYTQQFAAAANASSPGENELVALASGANTITPPTGARAVTILPPAANTVLLTLKGVTGDTGVVLHLTDPAVITLNNAATTFCLTAASTVTVRMIWT